MTFSVVVPNEKENAVTAESRRARWKVTHPLAPGTQLVGSNVGANVLSLPGGTYTDITLDPAQGWVWRKMRPSRLHRVFEVLSTAGTSLIVRRSS